MLQVVAVCEAVASCGCSPAAASMLVSAAGRRPEDLGWQSWALPLSAGQLINSQPLASAEVGDDKEGELHYS
jgi:hypothetical protein